MKNLALLIALAITGAATAGDELTVLDVSPAARSIGATVNAPIAITFDRAVDLETVTTDSFWAFGKWSGTVRGDYATSNGGATVTLTPDRPFSAGESVMVILSRDLRGMDGVTLRQSGYSYQFWVRANPATLDFAEIDSMTTRTTPGESSRAYGGLATDLNQDGHVDLTIVNEDTADLRIFMNEADGTGLFEDFMQPTTPVNDRASPSEPSDFNRDGFADICVANINTASVSIVLGNGDGTFQPQQEVPVGFAPRGIAVLDVDGDGDIDIVNTNADSGNLSLMLNDGTGVFGPAAFFEGGTFNEWALASADMNEDGRLDLILGSRGAQRVVVHTSNGDGTFDIASTALNVGQVWMLVIGDVNNDGHIDVSTANSGNNDGSILLGDGTGGVTLNNRYDCDNFPLATDLGDMDGDGDLDWVLSSFQGDWFLFENLGGGFFGFHQEFNAPIAASCALMADIDTDGDLDLALIDELADVVILMQQADGLGVDLNGDGSVDAADLAILLAAWGSNDPLADLDQNGVVDSSDLAILLANWTG